MVLQIFFWEGISNEISLLGRFGTRHRSTGVKTEGMRALDSREWILCPGCQLHAGVDLGRCSTPALSTYSAEFQYVNEFWQEPNIFQIVESLEIPFSHSTNK